MTPGHPLDTPKAIASGSALRNASRQSGQESSSAHLEGVAAPRPNIPFIIECEKVRNGTVQLVKCLARFCDRCGKTVEIGGGNGDHELKVHQNGSKCTRLSILPLSSSRKRSVVCDDKPISESIHSDRLRRVRSYSKDPARDSKHEGNKASLGNDLVVGAPALTYFRVTSGYAAAIIRVSAIITGNGSHPSGVTLSDLAEHSITVKGQVLTLTQCDEETWHSDTSIVASTNDTQNRLNQGTRLGTQGNISRQMAIIETKGYLVKPIRPSLGTDRGRTVWQFNHQTLLELARELWQSVSSCLAPIPRHLDSLGFPYRTRNGSLYLVEKANSEASDDFEKVIPCLLCGKKLARKSMRMHVAKHIAAYRHNLKDPDCKSPIGDFPCGYCGRSNNCNIAISKPGNYYEASSSCKYFTRLTMARTKPRPSKSNPSTNRPIVCELCMRLSDNNRVHDSSIFWSYNMERHVALSHPDELSRLSDSFAQSFAITDDELVYLKLKPTEELEPEPKHTLKRELGERIDSPPTRQRLSDP